jgi:hypothetical protein
MDCQRFDQLTRIFTQTPTRRTFIKGLIGAALAGVVRSRVAEAGAACAEPCLIGGGQATCCAENHTCCLATDSTGQPFSGLCCLPGYGCSHPIDEAGNSLAVCTCGSTGTACGSGCCFNNQTCDPLTYQCVCPSNQPDICTAADGTVLCVNRQSDPNHCGGCGMSCESGQICSGGACAFPTECSSGLTTRGGICVDTTNDPNNCGTCGHVCPPGQSCSEGSCFCPGAQLPCGDDGHCVDTQNDPENCGACGHQCPIEQVCTNGACDCENGKVPCGEDENCYDLTSDPNNCGLCGLQCAANQRCVGGLCICNDAQQCGNGTCCDPGEKCTGLGSSQHCCPETQACGLLCCDPGQVCYGGQCGTPCGPHRICTHGKVCEIHGSGKRARYFCR